MPVHAATSPGGIGTLREGPLHAALKEWYRRPGDLVEQPVDGCVVDLVRGPLLVELQTAGFAALRTKLPRLLARHPVRLVHPVAARRTLVDLDARGRVVGRRRSPRRGSAWSLFAELVSLPWALAHPGLELEVLLTEEELVRGTRRTRRRRRPAGERRLLAVLGRVRLAGPADAAALLPDGLPEPFTTADLARGAGIPRHLAQQAAYCLRHAGAVELRGRRGRSLAYTRADASPAGHAAGRYGGAP